MFCNYMCRICLFFLFFAHVGLRVRHVFTHEAGTLSCRPLSVPHPERSCPTLG